jgi:hypothetical protein
MSKPLFTIKISSSNLKHSGHHARLEVSGYTCPPDKCDHSFVGIMQTPRRARQVQAFNLGIRVTSNMSVFNALDRKHLCRKAALLQ